MGTGRRATRAAAMPTVRQQLSAIRGASNGFRTSPQVTVSGTSHVEGRPTSVASNRQRCYSLNGANYSFVINPFRHKETVPEMGGFRTFHSNETQLSNSTPKTFAAVNVCADDLVADREVAIINSLAKSLPQSRLKRMFSPRKRKLRNSPRLIKPHSRKSRMLSPRSSLPQTSVNSRTASKTKTSRRKSCNTPKLRMSPRRPRQVNDPCLSALLQRQKKLQKVLTRLKKTPIKYRGKKVYGCIGDKQLEKVPLASSNDVLLFSSGSLEVGGASATVDLQNTPLALNSHENRLISDGLISPGDLLAPGEVEDDNEDLVPEDLLLSESELGISLDNISLYGDEAFSQTSPAPDGFPDLFEEFCTSTPVCTLPQDFISSSGFNFPAVTEETSDFVNVSTASTCAQTQSLNACIDTIRSRPSQGFVAVDSSGFVAYPNIGGTSVIGPGIVTSASIQKPTTVLSTTQPQMTCFTSHDFGASPGATLGSGAINGSGAATTCQSSSGSSNSVGFVKIFTTGATNSRQPPVGPAIVTNSFGALYSVLMSSGNYRNTLAGEPVRRKTTIFNGAPSGMKGHPVTYTLSNNLHPYSGSIHGATKCVSGRNFGVGVTIPATSATVALPCVPLVISTPARCFITSNPAASNKLNSQL